MRGLRTMVVFVLAQLMTVSGLSNQVSDEGAVDLCTDPVDCDGGGVDHLEQHRSLTFDLDGVWNMLLTRHDAAPPLELDPTPAPPAVLKGEVRVARAGRCGLRMELRGVKGPGVEEHQSLDAVAIVSKGKVERLCGRRNATTHTPLHALALGVASSLLHTPTHDWDMKDALFQETDYLGTCMTKYHLADLTPDNFTVVRSRDGSSCPGTNHDLAWDMSWRCRQEFSGAVKAQFSRGATLRAVRCRHDVAVHGGVAFTSKLNLTLREDVADQHQDMHDLVPLDALIASPSTASLQDVTQALDTLCSETLHRVTPTAALTHAHLVTAVNQLTSEELVVVLEKVEAGMCGHQMLRQLFLDALRDAKSSAASATKCSLMAGGSLPRRRSWLSSLAATRDPGAQALEACASLLEGDQWQDAVLGVSALAGRAAARACEGVRGRRCFLEEGTGCYGQDDGGECALVRGVVRVVKQLTSRLSSCSSAQPADVNKTLVALRGLGEVGAYGRDVGERVRACSEQAESVGVRVAALATMGRGPCFPETTNALKWKIIDITAESEVRIAAFRSLFQCDPNEAEDVATFILKKESDTQVKSYMRSVVSDDTQSASDDPRQYSRRYSASLDDVWRDSRLDADVVFQSSFIPRSLDLNLTSPLLHLFGGSAQFGVRVERLEQLLQSMVGPGAGDGVAGVVAEVLRRALEAVGKGSQDFIHTHRSKRSHLDALLAKAREELDSILRGWVYAGLGGQDTLFVPFHVKPLELDWEPMLEQWVEDWLTTMYQELLNNELEASGGWSAAQQQVTMHTLVGTPLTITHQAGALYTFKGHSKINILRLLTNMNPTLDVTLNPSVGVYRAWQVAGGGVVARVFQPTTANTRLQVSLKVQDRGDNIDLKLDLPDDAFHGVSSEVHSAIITTQAQHPPLHDPRAPASPYHTHGLAQHNQERECQSHVTLHQNATSLHQRNCLTKLNEALGLQVISEARRERYELSSVIKQEYYVRKAEGGISGYRMTFNWKNPGNNSKFLDLLMEAEGSSSPRSMGLVFGLAYSPHFTLKVLLHSTPFMAATEVTLVNDPNLKRFEAHVSYSGVQYAIKAELLMVQDGGQVSVKPRLVVSYPGVQEDALLEGYLARYLSSKVASLSFDLHTEGTFKRYFDTSLMGMVEYRTPDSGDHVVTVKNLVVSIPSHTLGLELRLALGEARLDGNMEARWNGQAVMVNVSGVDLSSGRSDTHYTMSLAVALPDNPDMDTRLTCTTRLMENQISNNISITAGPESSMRDFQLYHLTSWALHETATDASPSTEASLTQDQHENTRAYPLLARVDNKLKMTSESANFGLHFDHNFQMNKRSLRNLVTCELNSETYRIKTELYDESEDLFKYRAELEMWLAGWQFEYQDTLQQAASGEVMGWSVTTMPSGRVYKTDSKYLSAVGGEGEREWVFTYHVQVLDAGQVWNILLKQHLEYSPSAIGLNAALTLNDLPLFELLFKLNGPFTDDLTLTLDTRVRRLLDGKVEVDVDGGKVDFDMTVFVEPLNREIKSRVLVGSDGCGGSVDGRVAWDARQDASQTLTFSSAVQLPDQHAMLSLAGAVSFLSWTWSTRLEVEFGQHAGDQHRVMCVLTLPDNSTFEVGSRLEFLVRDNGVSLNTAFDMRLPSGDFHNVSAVIKGESLEQGSLDGVLVLEVESPLTRHAAFTLAADKNTRGPGQVNVKVNTASEAGYWDPIDGTSTLIFNHSGGELSCMMTWGNLTIVLDSAGSYKLVGVEHQVKGLFEMQLPGMEAMWRQVKAVVNGTFRAEHNPSKLQVSHFVSVYKDFEEVLTTQGDGSIEVPRVKGRVSLTHLGSLAKKHLYTINGTLGGSEVLVEVGGNVDDTPVHVTFRHVVGREVTVYAYYRAQDFLSATLKTELRNVSFIQFPQSGDDGFSLVSDGQVVYNGSRTRFHHQLSLTPTSTTSSLRIAPFMGRPLKLTKSRTKHGADSWSTDVALSWGDRNFTYRDHVFFAGFRDCDVTLEVDAPYLGLDQVTARIESQLNHVDDKALKVLYLVHNDTVHSARMNYYSEDGEEVRMWRGGVSQLVVRSRPYSDLAVTHVIMLPGQGIQFRSNLTIGDTPVVTSEVGVTPDTRELLVAVCSTQEECVRVRAHTHSHTTPSHHAHDTPAIRTFSVAAHALNSLLWHEAGDPLVQNSITFLAEETGDEVRVVGGVRRVECTSVLCHTFTQRHLVHATLRLNNNKLDLTVDTSNRTIRVLTITKQPPAAALAPSSLPGGRLAFSSGLESRVWLDAGGDPEGAVVWEWVVARYVSARAAEWTVSSRLAHKSLQKALRVGGSVVGDAVSARAGLLLDVFTSPHDALNVSLQLTRAQGSNILVANVTRSAGVSPRVLDVVALFLPAPDSAQVKVVLLVPHWMPGTPQHQDPQFDAQFSLTCGLDSTSNYRHAMAHCTVGTPSVRERVSAGYSMTDSGSCRGVTTSLGVFNRTYVAEQLSCLDPSSVQASLALKSGGKLRDELALRLGLLSPVEAEVDVLDAAHAKVQLYPPFLLHAMAHSRGSLPARWTHLKEGSLDELNHILASGSQVAAAMAGDMDAFRGLKSLARPSPAATLGRHVSSQVFAVAGELRGDPLLNDLVHLARACVDVTSVMVEAVAAYFTQTFGGQVQELSLGVQSWVEGGLVSLGSAAVQAVSRLRDSVASSLAYLSQLPRTLVDTVLGVPLIGDVVSWVRASTRRLADLRLVQLLTEALAQSIHHVHKVVSLVYPWRGTPYTGEVAQGVTNLWVVLPECAHSLGDVWQMVAGGARTARHKATVGQAVHRWLGYLHDPSQLVGELLPPFPGFGAVVGGRHVVSLDGVTYTVEGGACGHVLVTTRRPGFTLTTANTDRGRHYTLHLHDTNVTIAPDLQVSVNEVGVSLPYTNGPVRVTRTFQAIHLQASDHLGRPLTSLTCWEHHRACVVGVSGWMREDVVGLLGSFDLNPTNELMRPSGNVASSGSVFSRSWQVGEGCRGGRVRLELPHDTRAQHICRAHIMHHTSPVYPCLDTVDPTPYMEICIRYLVELKEAKDDQKVVSQRKTRRERRKQRKPRKVPPQLPTNDSNPDLGGPLDNPSNSSEQPRRLMESWFDAEDLEASPGEMEAVCDVMAAYTSVCGRRQLTLRLPRVCGKGRVAYHEPASPTRQLDVVMLVDEDECGGFEHEHLVQPLPPVINRMAHEKNISDVKMGLLGFGSGEGDLTYHVTGKDFLSAPSRLDTSYSYNSSRPLDVQQENSYLNELKVGRASLLTAMRALSNFPFRPGSARVGLVVRCSHQDLPEFGESLIREMKRRRLSLFTLTPDLLLFDPVRPKAVRNTIGMDRWRVYSLRGADLYTKDSWGVREPSSNIADLAFKSGGGVFTVTPLRDEDKAGYYMKLFRKVLSRAVIDAASTFFDQQFTQDS